MASIRVGTDDQRALRLTARSLRCDRARGARDEATAPGDEGATSGCIAPARLDPDRFTRVRRSYMVNLGHVASIEPLDAGDARIHMRDAAVVLCSRRYRNGLRERLGVEG